MTNRLPEIRRPEYSRKGSERIFRVEKTVRFWGKKCAGKYAFTENSAELRVCHRQTLVRNLAVVRKTSND
jgi:hypothetical protein